MTEVVYGVEKVELGTPGVNGALATDFVVIENITEASVTYTSNVQQKTNIIPEDKDVPLLVLFKPGDPDIFKFGLLDISPANLQRLFNVEVDLANGSVTILASRKKVPMQIRLTTRAQFGVKRIFVFRNCLSTCTWTGNFTKDNLVSVSVEADLLAFKTDSGKDAIFTIQTINDSDGSVVDEILPTVGITGGASQTGTVPSKSLTATATAHGTKTIASSLWTQVSGPNTATIGSPNALVSNMTGLVAGTYVFQFTATDSEGFSASTTVSLVMS